MRKYISRSSVSFSILVAARERRIRFTESSRGGSVFFCDDEKVCRLIEARKDFGTVYRLDPFFPGNSNSEPARPQDNELPVTPPAIPENDPVTPPVMPVAPPAAPETTSARQEVAEETPAESPEPDDAPMPVEADAAAAPEVKTLSEAKEFLKLLGAQPTALRSKAGVLQTAQSLGISFPNMQ